MNRILVDELLADLEAEYRLQQRPCLRTFIGHKNAWLAELSGLRAADFTSTRSRMIARRWQADGS